MVMLVMVLVLVPVRLAVVSKFEFSDAGLGSRMTGLEGIGLGGKGSTELLVSALVAEGG
jgi:hypothetical protein